MTLGSLPTRGSRTSKVAPVDPFAGGGDRAAMKLDEAPHDRQAQAQAALRARRRSIGLAKALEDVGQEIRRDAGAGVADGHDQLGVHDGRRDLHATAWRRELE